MRRSNGFATRRLETHCSGEAARSKDAQSNGDALLGTATAKPGLDGQSSALALCRLETICGDEQRIGEAWRCRARHSNGRARQGDA